MKRLIVILCLLFLLGACNKDNQPNRELLISADGVLPGGSHIQLDESSGSLKGYNVYLHKGKIELTNEILKDPYTNSCNSSMGIFFKDIDEGEYTVIVDVHYARKGAFGTSNYSGVAYTTIKYPSPDLSKKFTFDWDKNVPTYEDSGITYVNMRPPYSTD